MMNTLKQYRRWALSATFLSLAVASAVGFYVGYQNGFDAYYNSYIDALLENTHYTDNPVDCPPCNVRETYEWFYKEPPTDTHLPEEEENLLLEKEKNNEPE